MRLYFSLVRKSSIAHNSKEDLIIAITNTAAIIIIITIIIMGMSIAITITINISFWMRQIQQSRGKSSSTF